MGKIEIHPDLRTVGGEMNDLMLDGFYVGSMTLNYREGKRLVGSVQLDATAMETEDKKAVLRVATDYIQALIDAYEIADCHVIVTYSEVDHVIATQEQATIAEELEEPGEMSSTQSIQRERRIPKEAQYLELVIVGEHHNTIEYHIHDEQQRLQAEVFVSILDRDVVGEVNWQYRPSEEQIEHVTDLIVSDYDDREIDTFLLEMKYNEELLEIVELAHHDFFAMGDSDDSASSDSFTVVLTRDDGDVLTYGIYDPTRGGLPVATATVDISRKELSGIIDFREAEDEERREEMALRLMQELDKEKEYETLGLTMMHNNVWMDEIVFEQSSSTH